MMNRGVSTDPDDPGLHRVLTTAARHALPVNLMCTGRLEQAAQLAERHPNTQVVIDHLGLPQPQETPAPADPFADLPKLLPPAAPARCRTNRSPTRTSGIRWPASSTPSACTAACGGLTGPALSRC